MNTGRDRLEREVRRALNDSLLTAVVQREVLEAVAEGIADRLVKNTWFIHEGRVREVESVHPVGPAGEEKESDRWDVYTVFED